MADLESTREIAARLIREHREKRAAWMPEHSAAQPATETMSAQDLALLKEMGIVWR